jgi:hypothetical protein
MLGMSKHEKFAAERSSATLTAAWSVLLTMGGTSVTYNVWHALHSGGMILLLAVLEGLAPVGAAMGLSEVGARFDGGAWFKAGAFAVMAGAMSLSMNATATVVRPAQGKYGSWLFGLVLDAAALLCLYVILTERERRKQAAKDARQVTLEEAVAAAVAETEARMTSGAEELRRGMEQAADGLRHAKAQADAESGATIEGLRSQVASLESQLREALRSRRQVTPGRGPQVSARSRSDDDLADELRSLVKGDPAVSLKSAAASVGAGRDRVRPLLEKVRAEGPQQDGRPVLHVAGS